MSLTLTPTRVFVSVIRCLALCLALGLAAHAEEAKQHYDLAAGDAVTTFRQFSDVSGREILYSADAVRGVQTNAVHGDFTAIEALNLMVRGTPLIVVHDAKSDALGVRRREIASADPGPAAPAAPAPGAEGLAPAPAAPSPGAPETIRLDPFEVQTSKDTSYGALNSNSITAFNTELDKTPISADIMTASFMQDVDVTSIDALLTGYGAGIGTAFANPAGQSAVVQPGDRQNTTGFTMRGVNAGPIRLNGFVTEASNFATTTNFDIERVEMIHGPQGLLYGPGGAGGTIVATTNQAQFDENSGKVSERIDEFGSKRTLVDANAGNDWMAGTLTLMNEEDSYRRLYYGGDTNALYGQVAFRLPLNTTLRVDYQYTHQNLNDTVGGPTTINLGGAASDPRSGEQLNYLLFTGQAGALNPATGAPFPKYGAIDNGNLNWENVYSFPGASNWEIATNYNLDVVADTVWTKWLSTDLAFNYNRLDDLLGPGATTAMDAPGVSGNFYPNDWTMNYTPGESVQGNRRHKNFRAAALATNDFFGGSAKSQTSFGYDFQRQGKGGTTYGYYLSDSSGNLILTPGGSNLGRTAAPAEWWAVDNGPVHNPPVFAAKQAPLVYNPQNGQYYTRMVADPTNPAYVTAINPWGLDSLQPGIAGVSGGLAEDNYQKEITSNGLYLANFTSWWNDRLTTMFGYRYTYTANNIPNTSPTVYAPPYDVSKFGAPSYNFGADGRITSWLRWYFDYSANYNVSNGETDFYGRPIDESYGKGGEAGFKFTPLDGKISGSFDYYVNNENDYAVNSGGVNTVLAEINPVGLNGQYEGTAGAGTDAAENRTSRGLEMILNANPTPNWRIHFSATIANGTVNSNISYPILYNDQFYTDGKGNVTYANGAPFLVPVTPGSNVSSLTTTTNPAAILASGPTQQLTTAMIGSPASPYYAWQGGSVTTAGNILSTSNVGRVLKNFDVPGAGLALTGATGLPISDLQYAWPDPAKTGGSIIVTQAGQDTVGYPVYSLTLVNTYALSQGPLKGLGAVLAVSDQWRWRTYYYSAVAGGAPILWGQNALGPQINLNPFYERKFGRFLWRTQLNITNLTNHYRLELIPNNGTGYANPNNLTVRWDNQPRAYSWSNTLSF